MGEVHEHHADVYMSVVPLLTSRSSAAPHPYSYSARKGHIRMTLASNKVANELRLVEQP